MCLKLEGCGLRVKGLGLRALGLDFRSRARVLQLRLKVDDCYGVSVLASPILISVNGTLKACCQCPCDCGLLKTNSLIFVECGGKISKFEG